MVSSAKGRLSWRNHHGNSSFSAKQNKYSRGGAGGGEAGGGEDLVAAVVTVASSSSSSYTAERGATATATTTATTGGGRSHNKRRCCWSLYGFLLLICPFIGIQVYIWCRSGAHSGRLVASLSSTSSSLEFSPPPRQRHQRRQRDGNNNNDNNRPYAPKQMTASTAVRISTARTNTTAAASTNNLTRSIIDRTIAGSKILRDQIAATEANHSRQPFPRWGEEGIPLDTLMTFIKGIVRYNATTVKWPRNWAKFPETLYVVDDLGVWTSKAIRRRTDPRYAGSRVERTEGIAKLAWTILMTGKNDASRWYDLLRAISSGGFPYLVWYGDYKDCSYRNWKLRNLSIPLFTTCARVDCKYAFPLPTYKTIKDSERKEQKWIETFAAYRRRYPPKHKIRKVVWRGSLSGTIDNFSSPRWRLCKLVHDYPDAARARELLDVGLVSIPGRHNGTEINVSEVGGLKERIHPMAEFQHYVGILDIDGNSWSSRFGTLLCYNSVILKVEPLYVDYFHLKDLIPWKHYVPVSYDLSDLMERVEYVVHPGNERAIGEIVRNANEWCQTRMIRSSIATDVLDIWNAYVRHLNNGDPLWNQKWRDEKSSSIFGGKDFDMALL